MKNMMICLLILVAMLCSCQRDGSSSPTVVSYGVREGTDTSDADASAREAQEKLTYYEQLVINLQAELLTVRSQLYDLQNKKSTSAGTQEAKENSANPASDAQFTYEVGSNGAVITGYLGKDGDVSIPARLGGFPVVAISDRAFAGRTDLVSVTLPEGVVTVGWFAFSGCVSLTCVSIPQSVTMIEYGAFENCTTSTLTVQCAAGSYAERYARSYGMITKST